VAYDVSQHEVASSGDLIAVSPADGDGPGSVRIERSSLERWLVAGAKSSAASGCAFVDVVQPIQHWARSSSTIRWFRHSRRSVPMTRSMTAFARGDHTGVAMASIPIRLGRRRKSRP
jgi:hypothetical protein